MKPIVLGFAGKIASGKTTLSSQSAQTLGWPRVSFGEYVRAETQKRGLAESRESLQYVGESLLAADPEGFCRAVLAQANWKPDQPLVVDGIRHRQVVGVISRLVAPMRFALVFVNIDDSIRESRIRERDQGKSRMNWEIDVHSTEREAHSDLEGIADLVVDGSLPVEEVLTQIRSLLP